ncbi:amidohydrolase [Actinomadura sp. 7K507]|uniref:amidohydrolase n=1 Tax=Actinomadura sp. 7K507 TaxID=2530365 RepID=UPI001053FE34|nr:amidohydrolase [Actinomadura sp. 7K507]TDC92519.1 amidohydrolase [Actinomadura sp. 7K507]
MGNRLDRRRFLQGSAAAAAGAAIAGTLPAHAAMADPGGRGPGRGPADLIIRNGKVLLLDRHFRTAEAIAIRDGVVVAAGRDKDMRRFTGRGTQTLDAGGGTVLPGINDSHLHLGGFGLDYPPFTIDVDTATIEELVAAVRTAAEDAAPGAWIRGQGWNDNRLPRPPRRTDLDPVSGDHPVVLRDFSAHAVAVNSVVLRMAGITRDTVPPTGGVIEKDADGEPTGVLRETARDLIGRHVPPFTDEEVSDALDRAIDLLHSLGITSVTDPGIGLGRLALYERKARSGALGLRVNALLSAGTTLDELRDMLDAYEPLRGVDPRILRVAGVKVFGDGVPTAAQTAWLHEPYLDGSNGRLMMEGDTSAEQVANLHELIRTAHDAGLQIGTHATGDATIDAVVAGYLAAMRRNRRRRDLRHYVIHGDLTPRETLRKMARNDIGVNMNATIKYLLGRTLDPVLGPERTDYQWPYRSALDLGVRVSSASDASVTFPSWLQGVQSAVLREGRFGGVAGEAERITVKEALVTYTRTPAWQDHAERWKGTLEPGNAADVCVVDADLLGAAPHDLVDLPIAATVQGGRVVYDGKADARTKKIVNAGMSAGKQAHGAACLQAGRCCCRLAEI